MFIGHISVSQSMPGLKEKSLVVITRLVDNSGLVKIYTMAKLICMLHYWVDLHDIFISNLEKNHQHCTRMSLFNTLQHYLQMHIPTQQAHCLISLLHFLQEDGLHHRPPWLVLFWFNEKKFIIYYKIEHYNIYSNYMYNESLVFKNSLIIFISPLTSQMVDNTVHHMQWLYIDKPPPY